MYSKACFTLILSCDVLFSFIFLLISSLRCFVVFYVVLYSTCTCCVFLHIFSPVPARTLVPLCWTEISSKIKLDEMKEGLMKEWGDGRTGEWVTASTAEKSADA